MSLCIPTIPLRPRRRRQWQLHNAVGRLCATLSRIISLLPGAREMSTRRKVMLTKFIGALVGWPVVCTPILRFTSILGVRVFVLCADIALHRRSHPLICSQRCVFECASMCVCVFVSVAASAAVCFGGVYTQRQRRQRHVIDAEPTLVRDVVNIGAPLRQTITSHTH